MNINTFKLLLLNILGQFEVKLQSTFFIYFLISNQVHCSDTLDLYNKALNVKECQIGEEFVNYSELKLSDYSFKFLANLNFDTIIWKDVFDVGAASIITIDLDSSIFEREGSYEIYFENQSVSICSKDKLGVLYALNTIKLLCELSSGCFNYKYIYDYPDISGRYVHLVLPKENNKKVYDLIDLAISNRFNRIVLQIKDRVSIFPINKAQWSLSELHDIKQYCHNRGLQFILEIKFLTHQDISVFRGSELINKFTYNPANDEVKRSVQDILQTIAKEVTPDGIHIGFDELHGYRNTVQREKVQKKVDYSGYFEHLQHVLQCLSDLDLDCYMWCDMLLDPNEFRNFTAHGWPLKPQVLKEVPESIILCDWQYWHSENFDSYRFLSSEGHSVVPATWCLSGIVEDYARYIKEEVNYNKSAIMCTTWPGALLAKRDIIVRKGCDLLTQEDIIGFSGKAFW